MPAPAEHPLTLLVSGRSGSGKTAACRYLADRYGAVCWSRAEVMKLIARALVDGIGDLDALLARIYSDETARAAVREELLLWLVDYRPEQSPIGLYQKVVDICQGPDPLCFERELETRILAAGRHPLTVIDDVMGVPEAGFTYFRERGARSLRIDASPELCRARLRERDGASPSPERLQHPAEVGLDEARHDFVVVNGDAIGTFQERLDRMIACARTGGEGEIRVFA